MLKLHSVARDCADSAILISGSARSGTTIVGKLVHSFDRVEYVFEPPALIALISQINDLPRQQWEFLYEAYLYEEFLINAISGRAINMNRADDSSIFAAKSEDEVMRRLDHSWRKGEANLIAPLRRAAYKIPNIVPYIPALSSRYPGMAVVMVVRGAVETINSLMAKHMFASGHPSSLLPWPFRQFGEIKAPYWLRLGDELLWQELNEVDRCAYYYIRMSEGVQASEHQFVLKYSDLVKSPQDVACRLADFLGLKFGACTEKVINTIKPSRSPLDSGVIDSISDMFRSQVVEYSARSE